MLPPEEQHRTWSQGGGLGTSGSAGLTGALQRAWHTQTSGGRQGSPQDAPEISATLAGWDTAKGQRMQVLPEIRSENQLGRSQGQARGWLPMAGRRQAHGWQSRPWDF